MNRNVHLVHKPLDRVFIINIFLAVEDTQVVSASLMWFSLFTAIKSWTRNFTDYHCSTPHLLFSWNLHVNL